MPAYSTNMRLKFPIVALTLEIITILLFIVYVVYDDGKSHHGPDVPRNASNYGRLELYPSKSTWCCQLLDGSVFGY